MTSTLQLLKTIAVLCQVEIGQSPHWNDRVRRLDCQQYYVKCVGNSDTSRLTECLMERKVQ
jgi:hypothetical protein